MYTVGVLALQGAFIEHRQMLDRLGVDSFEIRELKDIHRPMDGIIIPGGESTVIGRLLKTIGMFEPLKELI
ncbi:MAG: pyridoxal 5'-phosphate synthase glutaminase subunit PdxT, partial [Lachnospiraceae bacterium]|nr:pyridoxal 5'-phosphate synthase glutaminase subunit PdxT [Lachnospiraceae bacterium]